MSEDSNDSNQNILQRLFGNGIQLTMGQGAGPSSGRSGDSSSPVLSVSLPVTCRRGFGMALNLLQAASETWQVEEAFLVFKSFLDAHINVPLTMLGQFSALSILLEDNSVAVLPTSLLLSSVDDTGNSRRRHEKGERSATPLSTEDISGLLDFLKKASLPIDAPAPFSFLAEAFSASRDECCVVQAVYMLLRISPLSSMVPLLKSMRMDAERMLGKMLNISKQRVEAALHEGKMTKIGLLLCNGNATTLLGRTEALRSVGEIPYLDLHPGLETALGNTSDKLAEFLSVLRGRKVERGDDPLKWSDFAHVGPLAEMAATVMASVGGSIMLVGKPGTGKTQFALALADHIGRPAYSIGERDENGKEPRRGERFASLKAAIAVSGDAPILLVEEAEDMLQVPMGATDRFGFSKNHLNHFLDEVKSPVIWTTNSTEHIDPATLRRMAMIIPFSDPSSTVRERIWSRVLEREGGDIQADTHALAREWNASAGLCETAIRTSRNANAGADGITHVLDGFSRVIGGLRAREDTTPPAFDPELYEGSENLPEMVRMLKEIGPGDWSMCLHGEPGTGKSAFARYVCTQMGLEWSLKRASDLIDKYVGETEKKIADAFAVARMERKALIFDEADSMIASRKDARTTWEKTQTNEMLTQMEHHPLPFFATTNMMDGLDTASLRRFTFKMEFLNLSSTRARLAFERILGVAPPPGSSLPQNVSPGDMASLLKRKRIMRVSDPGILLKWLWEESELKEGKRLVIGFGGAA